MGIEIEHNIKQFIKKIKKIEDNDPSLKDNTNMDWEFALDAIDDWIPLSLSSATYIYPTLYPSKHINSLKRELPRRSFNIEEQICTKEEAEVIKPQWGEWGSFNESEITVFFHRMYNDKQSKELNQIIYHLLELHWVDNKKAFCKKNDNGNETEHIKYIDDANIQLILIRRKSLDKLLTLGNWVLIRYIRHYVPCPNIKLLPKEEIVDSDKFDHKYFLYYDENGISWDGAAINHPDSTTHENEKKHESFIIQNYNKKNSDIFDISNILEDYLINPDNIANQFTETDLPYELSPIFFNAAVLDKYKGDLENYILEPKTLRCKGSWSLQRYGINDYNQVYTHATDLNKLPYKEQLHWKLHNEKPKGPISRQTWNPGKKEALIKKLEALSDVRILGDLTIWKKSDNWDKTIQSLHPLHTEVEEPWSKFMQALNSAVIEGLNKQALKAYFEKMGGAYEEEGSLGLIKKILEKKDTSLIDKIHTILNDLRSDRTNATIVHGNWKMPESNLIEHAQKTLDNVIEAIDLLTQFFNTQPNPQ